MASKSRRPATSTTKYKFPLVEVIWEDAESDHGWEEDSEIENTATLAVTAGFLIREDNERIIVASTYDADSNSTNNRLKIPRGMIRSMKVLIGKGSV